MKGRGKKRRGGGKNGGGKTNETQAWRGEEGRKRRRDIEEKGGIEMRQQGKA